jgi:hypothetical protein
MKGTVPPYQNTDRHNTNRAKTPLEKIANHKASELLLQACYLPFVAVPALTVGAYDVTRSAHNPVLEFSIALFVLHAGLLAFWFLIFKRALATLAQLSFSKAAANTGVVLAYAFGFFIGWLVHKHG